jgi:hypothetical protein
MIVIRFSLPVLLFLSIFAVAAANPVLEKNTPKDVQMGMSLSALLANRPQAKDAGLTSKDGNQQFVEIVSSNGGRIAYWYRFKNEVLGAMTKSIMASKTPVEQVRESIQLMQKELQGSFDFIGSDQIVRSTGSQSELLTAQHWKEKAGALELYFVGSNQEITLVFFDPKDFGKKDFFLGPERLADVQANEKSVRALIKEMKSEPTKPEPMLLADLIPKKSTDAKPTTSVNPEPSPLVTPYIAPQSEPQKSSLKTAAPIEPTTTKQQPSPWFWIIAALFLSAVIGGILFKFLSKSK